MRLPASWRGSCLAIVLAAAAAGVAAEPRPDSPPATGAPAAAAPSLDADLKRAKGLAADGQYAEASALGQTLLAEAEAASGPVSAPVAEALDVIVEAERLNGRYKDPRVRGFAQRSIDVRERLLGPEHPDTSRSVNNLANLLSESGDYVDARPLYERVVRIQEATLKPDDPTLAKTYNNLANLISDMGDYAGSFPMYERALAIKEKAHGPEDPQLISTLLGLSILHRLTGDYPEALRLGERGLAIARTKLRPAHPRTAIALGTVASVHSEMGDFAEARALLEQALALQQKELPPDHPDLAATLGDLGDLDREAGALQSARDLYLRALAIQEHSLKPESAYVVPIRLSLGEVLDELGDADGARAEFRRALTISEDQLGRDHPDVAQSLDPLAASLERDGKIDEARALLQRGLALRQAGLGGEHPLVATSLARLAAIALRTGADAEALDEAGRAEAIGRRALVVVARASAERTAIEYAATRPSALDVEIELARRRRSREAVQAAWDDLIRSRGLVLDTVAARQRHAAGSTDRNVVRLGDDLRAARQQEAALWLRGLEAQSPESYRRLLEDARRREERLERALAATHSGPDSATPLSGGEVAGARSLEAVLRALPPGQALVGYATVRPAGAGPDAAAPISVAFVAADRSSAPDIVDLGPAARIDELILRWRAAIDADPVPYRGAARRKEEADRRLGLDLRRALWDPVAARLGKAAGVFLVPEGAINLVDFAALPQGKSGYLVETGPRMHYLSVESDLADLGGQRTGGIEASSRGLLIVGGPVFDRGPTPAADRPQQAAAKVTTRVTRGCEGSAALRFAPLAGAAREMEAIGALWSGSRTVAGRPVKLLSGESATKDGLERLAPGYDVVHVATHGFFLGDSCRIDGGGGSAANPLLLSGLALAGANEGAGGILTARELASIDLSSADLVVLSACQTGVGAIRPGEGVFGLRRAVRVAGAKALVMSLWRTGDETTRQWMSRFYERRLSGRSTAEAVRDASLALLVERRKAGLDTDPLHWAGFIATGDWR